MDLRFNTSDGFETRILERPALWMDEEDLAALRKDLIDVASKTIARGALTYGVFSEDQEALERTVITLVRDRETGQPIAFNALAVMEVEYGQEPKTVLHLGLVMVDPNVRSRGLSWVLYGLTCILIFVRNGFRPVWVSNVTQVPAVVGMVSETFSNVYPMPECRNRLSLTHLLLARRIMRDHRHVFGVGSDAGFDEDRFVITNAYTGGSDDLKKSFNEAQKHRDEIYNRFCEDTLDYDRGDDVLQLGEIDLNAARTYLQKSVPPGSFLTLLFAGAFVFLQRVALPIVYWFDASRSWGDLRGRLS
ncbi:MAG: hypothetical protein AAGE61_00270 [Pseudomonadota bacterium]